MIQRESGCAPALSVSVEINQNKSSHPKWSKACKVADAAALNRADILHFPASLLSSASITPSLQILFNENFGLALASRFTFIELWITKELFVPFLLVAAVAGC